MKIKVFKINPEAAIPKYSTSGSSGFDLAAKEDVFIGPGRTEIVSTGLSFEIPEGFEMQVRPRSGMSATTHLRVANAPGTIDSDFRGEVVIIISNTSSTLPCQINKGQRIAQGVIAPVIQAVFEEVDELTNTKRGIGGIGSSGAY